MKNLILNVSIKKIRIIIIILSILTLSASIIFFQKFPHYFLLLLIGIERFISLEKIFYREYGMQKFKELKSALTIGTIILLIAAVFVVIITFVFSLPLLELALFWIIAAIYVNELRKKVK